MSNPKGTAGLMACRSLAVELLRDGNTLTEVADLLCVSVSSIKRWKKAFQQGGLAALAPKRRPGPQSKLSLPQRQRLREIMLRGPLSAGFRTDLWTCRRVAEVVRREFGIVYHPDHLGRILHDLGFSPQKPQRRARERDEAAIQRWRREAWPRIKKRDGESKLPSSFSMKQASFSNP
jgi:transposase